MNAKEKKRFEDIAAKVSLDSRKIIYPRGVIYPHEEKFLVSHTDLKLCNFCTVDIITRHLYL